MLPEKNNTYKQSAYPISLNAKDISIIPSARAFKAEILNLIESCAKRIYITALYLQDDAAGSDILHALYKAKDHNPDLDIKIFVDGHRAQRGLIGDPQCLGNREFYRRVAEQYPHTIDIHGVLVKTKELFGVLHLKGLIFDDTVIYTGASINDVYLHQGDKCRFDRYHKLQSVELADSMVDYLHRFILTPGYSPILNGSDSLDKKVQNAFAKKQKKLLKISNYCTNTQNDRSGDIKITPLAGFGPRANKINICIRDIIRNSQQTLTVFTPYFNLPKILSKDLKKALRRGVKVTMIIGDKTANDFFIAQEEHFSKIGIIPYIYEILLCRFIKRHQSFIDAGLLKIYLWKNEHHSFHLKGLVSDDQKHLITGNNLNPRAWSLDLENGLYIEDYKKTLVDTWKQELLNVLQFTRLISHSRELENINDYPKYVRDPIRKLQVTQIDRIFQRFM